MTGGWADIRKQAEVLRELGVTPISDELVIQIEKQLKSMPAEALDSLNVTALLLSAIGGGRYDHRNHTWMPISDVVYSFDVEVSDVGNMYTLFLQGIAAISGDEFEITQVEENTDRVDFDSGTGTQVISFCYNGTPCSYEARVEHDWFDDGMLGYMNRIFEEAGNPKKLYFMSDGYQECIVFYCTEFWAKRFEKKTGCRLSHVVEDIEY